MTPPANEERISELPTQPMLRISAERPVERAPAPVLRAGPERPPDGLSALRSSGTLLPERSLPSQPSADDRPLTERPTRPAQGPSSEERPTQPQRAYQPGERAWQDRAKVHIALFLVRHPELAHAPHSEWVLQGCADLVWELRTGQARWSALSIHEAFRRAAHQHAYFPQPALLVALYDVLYAFVPWLAAQHLISRRSSQRLFEELQRARAPLVEDARRQLRMREQSTRRHGAWYEVLKTLGP